MKDPFILYKIDCKVSPCVQREIDIKKVLNTKSSHYECQIKFGSFSLSFD